MDTENAPWRSERPLDEAIVRRVLRDQFPGLPASDVAFLGEGWDSQAYLVDGEWVFRFPKRREVEAWLEQELRVLGRLAEFPLPFAVPRPEFVGEPSEAFPFAYVGYRWIAGAPSQMADPSTIRREAAARQLGAGLGLVHSIGEAECRGMGLRADPYDPVGPWREVRSLRETILPALPDDLRDACLPDLDGTALAPPGPVAPCLVHGDLAAEHLLIGGDGTISGLIDWGDASIGDPAGDFAWSLAWLGPEFARAALAAYPRPIDPAFRDRVVFHARRLALESLGWHFLDPATQWHDPVRYLRNVFG